MTFFKVSMGGENRKSDEYAFIIVGSGAGGVALAMELSKRGKQVLIVEGGNYEEKIGIFSTGAFLLFMKATWPWLTDRGKAGDELTQLFLVRFQSFAPEPIRA